MAGRAISAPPIALLAILAIFPAPVQSHSHLTSQWVNYSTVEGDVLNGYMTVDTAKCTSSATCPGVLIVPDWDGIDDYEMKRAEMVADLGYVAWIADIYGKAITDSWDNPGSTEYSNAANMHRGNATLFMVKILTNLENMMQHDHVDSSKMAAIGYCFGGTAVLNLALAGHTHATSTYKVPAGLLGVASFHAGTSGMISLETATSYPKISIHNGFSDQWGIVSDDMKKLLTDLDSQSGIEYEFSSYGAGVPHGFTVLGSSDYHEVADRRSWATTLDFFAELFDGAVATAEPTQQPADPYMANEVSYQADSVAATGYMVWNSELCSATLKCPGVAIVPDWTGMDAYEKHRAHLVATWGYVAFAMDIYGDDVVASWGGNPTSNNYGTASGMHQQDPGLFMRKIMDGIAQLASNDVVDSANMAVIGYCFGGTGAINVALAGYGSTYNVPTGVKAVIAYHAGEGGLIQVQNDTNSYPALSVHNGFVDPFGIKPDTMISYEQQMEDAQMHFETSWYGAGVNHGFTEWGGNAYDAATDMKSWRQTHSMLLDLIPPPAATGSGETTSLAGPRAGLFFSALLVFTATIMSI